VSNWRARSVQALVPLLNEARGLVAKGKLTEARALVKKAYPFGRRERWPYKIWCEEVRRYIPGLYPRRAPKGIKLDAQGVPLWNGDEP